MDKRFTPYGKTIIDPLFAIPDGAEDEFVYAEDSLIDVDESTVILADLDDGLGIPENFKIISQTVKRTSNGTAVIDIIIEVEDVEGAVSYEMKAVKV